MARDPVIKVAIIGGGPGGLGTAIAFSELPFVSVTVYEQAPEPREVGAGISIGQNAWNVLGLLGAADLIKGASKAGTLQRNGRTGEIINVGLASQRPVGQSTQHGQLSSIRTRRRRVQSALLAKVPADIVQYDKKVVAIEDAGPSRGARVIFKDGTETAVDLAIGADGIRSIVRRTSFPEHSLRPTGNTAWRVLIPVESIRDLKDFPETTAWWHGQNGHFYFSHVDHESERELYELTLRSYREDVDPERFAYWAVPATNKRVLSRVEEYHPKVKEILNRVPEGAWREFAMVAGPCLRNITAWDKIALIGDASHPLQGAFGSGAAFAMEDGWLLARALEYTVRSTEPIPAALRIFQEIRGPYYERMFQYLEDRGSALQQARGENKEFDELIRARVAVFGAAADEKMDWIYKHDIWQTWQNWVEAQTVKAS